jgi:hypothetical protein
MTLLGSSGRPSSMMNTCPSVRTPPGRPASAACLSCQLNRAPTAASESGTVRKPALVFVVACSKTLPRTLTLLRLTVILRVARSTSAQRNPQSPPRRRPVKTATSQVERR